AHPPRQRRRAGQDTFAGREALPKLSQSHVSICAPSVKVSPLAVLVKGAFGETLRRQGELSSRATKSEAGLAATPLSSTSPSLKRKLVRYTSLGMTSERFLSSVMTRAWVVASSACRLVRKRPISSSCACT